MPDSYRSRWSGMAFHSFLQRRSAPRKMVHLPSLSGNSIYSITVKSAFYDRSRMTGRHIIPFCKKLFYVSAHTYPFRRLRRHLSLKAKRLTHFYSIALLPEKWFASRQAGTAWGLHSSFISRHAGTTFYMSHFFIFVFSSCLFYSFISEHKKRWSEFSPVIFFFIVTYLASSSSIFLCCSAIWSCNWPTR